MQTRQPRSSRSEPADPETKRSAVPRQFRNLAAPELIEQALARGEGLLSDGGALAVRTGEHTGRSPRDKFVVGGEPGDAEIWWGEVNQPMAPAAFAQLQSDVLDFLDRHDTFAVDASVCADPAYATPVRVVTHRAWHALFARTMFRPALGTSAADPLIVLHAPGFAADPRRHETRSSTVIALSLEQRLVVIAGTEYAGEIKKAVFTALQALLPAAGVATMHCSANVGASGDVALFFGLSGTGKTTLSSDGERLLVGDDEHGWADAGVFNFEGGSYAKTIDLSPEAEPEIHAAATRFGTLLENVPLDAASRAPRFDDRSLTENTRAAFPLETLGRVEPSGRGSHPRNLIFLSADAFGVLPPVARLTQDQALYWYLSGYTARLAGTEKGLSGASATFSACFGAPFLPLPPTRYAALLGERIDRHAPAVWMVNTGWTGGGPGTGKRMPISLTRAIVRSILDGSLAAVPATPDPVFGVLVPDTLPGIDGAPLRPREAWADPGAYDRAARRLAVDIGDNFRRFRGSVSPAVAAAGPRPG